MGIVNSYQNLRDYGQDYILNSLNNLLHVLYGFVEFEKHKSLLRAKPQLDLVKEHDHVQDQRSVLLAREKVFLSLDELDEVCQEVKNQRQGHESITVVQRLQLKFGNRQNVLVLVVFVLEDRAFINKAK